MLVLHAPLPDVAGRVCEALLVQAYYYRGRLVSDANALFLRVAGGGWHRIFIDGGVLFWQAVDGLDSPDQDRHHYALSDLAAAHGLAGKRVVDVATADLPGGGALRLRFAGAPTVVLTHEDGRSRVGVEASSMADRSP
ncbi:MAG TPA: hypothetical protein VNN07_06780 [Candidatus Tectomicrobia bacterium]|nr:hypothetical protein [Candidatus Tectomicrobia bacterium]